MGGMTSRAADVAWAAGLFEGEGCIYVGHTRGDAPRVKMLLGMTDEDVVRRFTEIIGLGPHTGPHARRAQTASRKPSWEWRTSRSDEIETVIRLLYPHLGMRRRLKADEMLSALASVTPRNRQHCIRGHALAGDNLMIQRHPDGTPKGRNCRTCSDASKRQWRERQRDLSTP